MKLKILHVMASVNPSTGGPVEGVRQIARINRGYGHQIEVVSFDLPDDPWVRDFPQKIYALGPAYTHFRYCPRLVPWLRAHAADYDCVVVNGIWTYNCFGVWAALRNLPCPYYVYTHGMLDPWFKYRYPLKHFKKWLFWPWAVYPALRDAAGVMFTCEEERLLARESFWMYDCNEVVVNYGTPGAPEPDKNYAEGFLTRHPTLRDKRRFVFLGRVHPKKGPDVLIKAFAKILTEQAAGSTPVTDGSEPVLIMAGPTDGDYADTLKVLAGRLGIADRVYWTGMLQGDDKWGALQCGDAFLLPSHQENFGIAVAESLSVGVPVLISKSVNIWSDIIADGAGIAEADTVDGCVALFRRWLDLSEPERAVMRVNARECFLRRYTSRRAAVSLLANIYQVMHAAGRGVKS